MSRSQTYKAAFILSALTMQSGVFAKHELPASSSAWTPSADSKVTDMVLNSFSGDKMGEVNAYTAIAPSGWGSTKDFQFFMVMQVDGGDAMPRSQGTNWGLTWEFPLGGDQEEEGTIYVKEDKLTFTQHTKNKADAPAKSELNYTINGDCSLTLMDDSVGAAQPYWNLLLANTCVDADKSTFFMQRASGDQLALDGGKTFANTELTYTIYSVNWRTALYDATFKTVNYDYLDSDTSKKGTLKPLEESRKLNA